VGTASRCAFEEKSMKKSKKSLSILIAFALCCPNLAFGWGSRGHSVIDRTAIDTLPKDGPVFLQKYADYISSSASVPDYWRGDSEPFSKIEEDPNHGWFREQFAFMTQIPRSRYEFVLALYKEYSHIKDSDPNNARRMNVRWTGTLPYAAAESFERLVADMRLLRKARLEGRNTTFLEMTCAFEVVRIGHYIGDGSQPLHNTIHHDGWQGADPKGYTRDPEIHERFESQYVDAIALTEGDILLRIGAPSHLKGDVFKLILAYLDESGSNVEDIYKLDKRGGFADPHDQEARKMVYSRITAGAQMLRDLIYRAWLESALLVAPAKPDPADPDQNNAFYNPETGSAPASLSPDVIK
jgi:hypothetical protein